MAQKGLLQFWFSASCFNTRTWEKLRNAFTSAVVMTAMIFLIVAGAMVFRDFLALTEAPMKMSHGIVSLGLNRIGFLVLVMALHLILGMFIPVLPMLVLTVPLIYPTLIALDINILWFAVLMVLNVMIGALSPPVGLVVYILSGYAKVPIATAFRGVIPFIFALLVALAILIAFPEIVLCIPKLMAPGLFT